MSNDKQTSSAGVIQTLEEKRWQDTLQALEAVSQGKVVDVALIIVLPQHLGIRKVLSASCHHEAESIHKRLLT